jgi:hypothetical protein
MPTGCTLHVPRMYPRRRTTLHRRCRVRTGRGLVSRDRLMCCHERGRLTGPLLGLSQQDGVTTPNRGLRDHVAQRSAVVPTGVVKGRGPWKVAMRGRVRRS